MQPVVVPRMSANDDSVRVVKWLSEDRTPVKSGTPICVLETSKAIHEIESPTDGFLRILVDAGRVVTTGDTIAVIAASVNESIPTPAPKAGIESAVPPTHSMRSITAKAEIVARSLGVDLSRISGTETITEEKVRALAGRLETRVAGKVVRLLIFGGGRGAVQVLNIVRRIPHIVPCAILDDNQALKGEQLMEVPIVGAIGDFEALMARGSFDEAIVSISANSDVRKEIFDKASGRGVKFANIIHPNTEVGVNVKLGTGNVILGSSRLAEESTIGDNNFISAYVNIEHHAVVGSHVTFGPGVFLSGSVTVGDGVKFGTSIGVEPGVRIGAHARIGSGLAVVSDVPTHGVLKTRIPTLRSRSNEA